MKKRMALTAMMLGAAVVLSGCNLIGYDEALDHAQVVAKVNDAEITKADWLGYRDYLVSYYQQMYAQYGMSFNVTEDDLAALGESALEDLIRSQVVSQKAKSVGIDPLNEEDTQSAEEYVDSMLEFYKMMIRYQNYAGIETVEEEAKRLADAAAEAEANGEVATPSEAVASVTDAEMEAMLNADLSAMGYDREALLQSQISQVLSDKIYEYATSEVAVTDEEVSAEYASKQEAQQANYDANPTAYGSAVSSGSDIYYVPAGYRGVKNLLIGIDDEAKTQIDSLNTELNTAKNTVTSVSTQLDELLAMDTSEYDEEAKASHEQQIAALEEQLSAAQEIVDGHPAKIEQATAEAFAAIQTTAEEVLAKAKAGEDFDALVETYGEDPGMKSEPNKSTGYMVCEGLNIYEQSFQDAAMALTAVGEITNELVQTSYGYHIMQYACDVEAGPVEMDEESAEAIREELLSAAKDAAYEAAVTQWVSEATVKTFPKTMK